MKTASVLTYVVIIVCLIEVACSDLNDFLSQVSSEVGGIIHTTWTKIITTLKEPVRRRKLRRGGRQKRTTPVVKMTTQSMKTSTAMQFWLRLTRPVPAIPNLPVFTTPPFKSIVEWRKQQLPYIPNRNC